MTTWKKKDDDTTDSKPDAKWVTKKDDVGSKVDDGSHANDTAEDKTKSATSFDAQSTVGPNAADGPPNTPEDVAPLTPFPPLQGRTAAALGQNIPIEHYQGDDVSAAWKCASCGRMVVGIHCPIDGDTELGNGNGRAPGPSRGPTLPALPSTPSTPNTLIDGSPDVVAKQAAAAKTEKGL